MNHLLKNIEYIIIDERNKIIKKKKETGICVSVSVEYHK